MFEFRVRVQGFGFKGSSACLLSRPTGEAEHSDDGAQAILGRSNHARSVSSASMDQLVRVSSWRYEPAAGLPLARLCQAGRLPAHAAREGLASGVCDTSWRDWYVMLAGVSGKQTEIKDELATPVRAIVSFRV